MPEQFLTEEMHMTTTTARQAISDAGRYPPPEDRRAAARELAEAIVGERGHHEQPWTKVKQLVVPTLAAASCTNQLAAFEDVCEAIATRRKFVEDPDTWLVDHDLSLGSATWERYDELTEAEIDDSLDALMGVRRGVRR